MRHTIVVFMTIFHTVTSQIEPVNPPIVNIANNNKEVKDNELPNDITKDSSTDRTINRKYDVTVMKFPRVFPAVLVPEKAETKTSTTPMTTTSAISRDTSTNKVKGLQTLPSEFAEDLIGNEDFSNCAFSFSVPNPLPRNKQVCVKKINSVAPHGADDISLSLLQDKVLSTQKSVDQLRTEMAELGGTESSGQLHEEVRHLQKESRNMNFRVSQLYMQLLHEIIRKRDDTIEYTTMENDILNVTVKYYELKEKHEALVQAHNRLKREYRSQQGQITRLEEKVEEIMRKINRIGANEELTPNDSRSPSIVTSQNVNNTVRKPDRSQASYADCVKIQEAGFSKSGVYHLKLPTMTEKMRVWCDFDQDPGGWIVIQRRVSHRLNFYRNMASYQRGFGTPDADFWLGLENMHQLTTQDGKNYKLHIDMEDWNSRKTFVEYGSFKVSGEDDGYRLKVAHYSGTAGDSLTWHNNMKFTTKNVDQDPFLRNCANYQKGGWWYNQCAHSNLNGVYYTGGHYRSNYQDGIYWSEWRGGSYSLKKVEMKIRPSE